MDMNYYMKIQNAYGTKNRREKELVKVNHNMSKHFEDTYDTEDVLINDVTRKLMIIKTSDSNVVKKKIKSPHEEKFNLGDYVIWNDQYWLITSLDPDEKTWNRGYMCLCTIPLRWQDTSGNIIEKWCCSEGFSKYSDGVAGNNTITIADNQYGLTLPICEETKRLKRDMRFPIDFDDAEIPDVYTLTNKKMNYNNNQYFGRGGVMYLTLSFDAYNKDSDRRVKLEDGKEVWIAGYIPSPSAPPDPDPPDETANLFANITGNTNLKVGYSRSYSVNFTDKDVVAIEGVNYEWNVESDFADKISQTISGNTIKLQVNDDSLIGSHFLLCVLIEGKRVGEIEITVVELMA